MSKNRLDKNIIIYYIFSIFQEPIMLGPIVVLFFFSRGLSFTQIMLLQAICTLSMFLFEIPTGAISDVFKRKYVIAMSGILSASGIFILAFATNFYLFALSEIIFALGISLASGSKQALLYDHLLEKKQEKDFSKIQGFSLFLLGIVTAIGVIISGYLFEINPVIPVLICGFWMLIGSVAILFFKEKRITNQSRQTFSAFKENIKSGFLYTKNNKRVRTIIAYSAFLYFFFCISFWLYPIYMEGINISPRHFGYVFAVMNVIYAISCKYAHVYIKATKGFTLISLSWIISIGYIFSGLIRGILGMFSFTGEQLVRGVEPIAINKYINKHIPSEMRATILSYNSLIRMVVALIMKLVFGVLIDTFGVFDVRLGLGITMFLGVLFFSKYLRKNLCTQ